LRNARTVRARQRWSPLLQPAARQWPQPFLCKVLIELLRREQDRARLAMVTIRLSGIVEALPARVAQAEAAPLAHLEFLELLVEDELAAAPIASLRDGSNKPASSPSRRSPTSTGPSMRSSRNRTRRARHRALRPDARRRPADRAARSCDILLYLAIPLKTLGARPRWREFAGRVRDA